MTIETRSPLSLEDIPFDEPGGPVRFDNPSDTIFASLFLPTYNLPPEDNRAYHQSDSESDSEDSPPRKPNDFDSESIPWQFCDRILSAIRSPQFNPKDITFKDCGDMFRCIGRRRHDMWLAVEARSMSDSSFPLVILDGVLEWIKAQRLSIGTQSPIEERHFQNRLQQESDGWKKCLQNMMLVRSSWHASVKRLLGYKFISSQGPTPNGLQNPVFGMWTREAYLSYHYDDNDSDDSESVSDAAPSMLYPIAPNKRHWYFLSTLCSIIPNIRLVHLCLSEFSVTGLATVFAALSTLTLLEELILEADRKRILPLQMTIDAIANTHLPTLRVLRLYAQRINCDNPRDALHSLDSLEKLHSVQTFYPDTINARTRYTDSKVCSVLWSRETFERTSPLAVNELQIDCCTLNRMTLSDGSRHIGETIPTLRIAKLIKFHFKFPGTPDVCSFGDDPESLVLDETVAPDQLARAIAPWLRECTAARTLVFHKLPWMRMEIFKHLHERLPDVEEVLIEYDSLPWPPCSDSWDNVTDEEIDCAKHAFCLDDAALSQVVGTGLFPGLRILKVVVPEQVLKIFDGGLEDIILFPHCRQKCAESSVELDAKTF